jgi:hypothetical protein
MTRLTSPPQLPCLVPCCCKVLDAVLPVNVGSHTPRPRLAAGTATIEGDAGANGFRRHPSPSSAERVPWSRMTFPRAPSLAITRAATTRKFSWKQVPGFCMPAMGRWQWAEDLAREDDLRTSRPDDASCLARSILMEDGASASPPCGTLLRPCSTKRQAVKRRANGLHIPLSIIVQVHVVFILFIAECILACC